MNYLAHAYLSPPEPLVLLGNLWGDLLRPKDYSLLAAEMMKGVELHKQIDTYTDAHPAVDEMLQLIRPSQGKYAPVVTDVLMDYILSTHWNKYHHESIESFCHDKYEMVDQYLSFIPARLHARIKRMRSHHWLESCKNRERMEQALAMLSQRASFENNMATALTIYDQHQQRMDELFFDFFEKLNLHVSLQNEG